MSDTGRSTKEKLLDLLEDKKGRYLSGEEIAGKLGLTRAAVWKAVKGLRDEGYVIEAGTKRGYCLSFQNDRLSARGIGAYLGEDCRDLDIRVLATADSTNELVRKQADAGFLEGYTVVANEQTAGRGRFGRSFFSPGETGLYLSILLRPPRCPAERALGLTTMAAAAMCEAVEAVSDEDARIKWVNDIYVRGKKVCGILTEASLSLESGLVEYAVLGVGLNVYPPKEGFPEDIRETAGWVLDRTQDDGKNRLAGLFLNRFMGYYRGKPSDSYIETYKAHSLAVGKRITVVSGGTGREAYAYGIDEACRLQVRYGNGETEALSCGEIHIRSF